GPRQADRLNARGPGAPAAGVPAHESVLDRRIGMLGGDLDLDRIGEIGPLFRGHRSCGTNTLDHDGSLLDRLVESARGSSGRATACRTAALSTSGEQGFVSTATNWRGGWCSARPGDAVYAMTRAPRVAGPALSSLVASIPSSTGMAISMTMTAGCHS